MRLKRNLRWLACTRADDTCELGQTERNGDHRVRNNTFGPGTPTIVAIRATARRIFSSNEALRQIHVKWEWSNYWEPSGRERPAAAPL
eukprot:scaffold142686_cov31-Tisochrysis_lutea.AAC.3